MNLSEVPTEAWDMSAGDEAGAGAVLALRVRLPATSTAANSLVDGDILTSIAVSGGAQHPAG